MSLLLWLMSLALRSDLAQPVASAAIAGVRTHAPVVALYLRRLRYFQAGQRIRPASLRHPDPGEDPGHHLHDGHLGGNAPRRRPPDRGCQLYRNRQPQLLPRPAQLVTARPLARPDRRHQSNLVRCARTAALELRPPAGAWNRQVLLAAARAHLPVVLWTVVSGDAGGHVPAERMRRLVLAQTERGAIVIFHINGRGPFTKEVLSDIITGLRAKGFRFVTVSQLLSLPDAILVSAPPTHDQPERK